MARQPKFIRGYQGDGGLLLGKRDLGRKSYDEITGKVAYESQLVTDDFGNRVNPRDPRGLDNPDYRGFSKEGR